jgi:hypothetical protein
MATKVGTADIMRVLGTYNQKELEAKYGAEMAAVIMALSQSAWAANNSVDVGMAETAEVLNAMLAEPGAEQIYTTQPAWDFNEEQSYRLGSYVDIDGEGNTDTPIYDDGWSDPAEGYTRYPIPSLIYDTDGNAHVVFPVWSWLAADGFRFRPMDMPFRHNCNYLGGSLDGFAWQEVSLTSGYSVTVRGDAQTGFTASVPTTATVAVGTWVRLTYTESDASKTAYGYVSAVGTGNVTVTVVGACGTTVTKVELYKPIGQ